MNSDWIRKLLVGCLSLAILLGCSENNSATASQPSQSQSDQTQGTTQQLKDKSSQGSTSTATSNSDLTLAKIPDVVDKVLPSVVQITATKTIERQIPRFMRPFLRRRGGQRQYQTRGLGSGVVVDKNGTIITNSHVISNADEIMVKFNDGKELEAEIVGSDDKSEVAVVQLKNPPSDLDPIQFGNSDNLRLGETVVAIGSPFGLSSTVTMGIVSATGRADVGIADFENFIQTDAAINPGNSGGALVNTEGELIGINTAIASKSGGYQGIGFAIPSNMAENIMNSLVEHGEVKRGWLGVAIQNLQPGMASHFGVPEDTQGVLISQVKEGSPADKAGIKQDDIVIKAGGEEVTSASRLRNLVATQTPESKMKFVVYRDGTKKKMTIKLGQRGGDERKASGETEEMLKGLSVAPVNAQTRQQFNIPRQVREGIVVTDVKRGSPAARTGLRPGDVIAEVNRSTVASLEEFEKYYSKADETVLLLVIREGTPLYLTFKK